MIQGISYRKFTYILVLLQLAVLSGCAVDPRTPIESVPYRITHSGSYYLAANLQVGTTDTYAIKIEADSVTLDLMGFTLSGSAAPPDMEVDCAMDSGRSGIYLEDYVSDITILNGTIRDFVCSGIEQQEGEGVHPGSHGNRVLSVRVVGNKWNGISLLSDDNEIRDCSAISNGNIGLYSAQGSVMMGNTASRNGVAGIYTGESSLVTGNNVQKNGTPAVTGSGIVVTAGSTVSDNTVTSNTGNGIQADMSLITGNTVFNNNIASDPGKGGIVTKTGTYVLNNNVSRNGANNISVGQSGYIGNNANVIEHNQVTAGVGNGINFNSEGNYFSGNRLAGNGTNLANTTGNHDGGGNDTF